MDEFKNNSKFNCDLIIPNSKKLNLDLTLEITENGK